MDSPLNMENSHNSRGRGKVGGVPGESEIGLKLSIRCADPEGGFRDYLGILISLDTVQRRNGELKTFNPQSIVLWKIVS